jgi:hypothetical protein
MIKKLILLLVAILIAASAQAQEQIPAQPQEIGQKSMTKKMVKNTLSEIRVYRGDLFLRYKEQKSKYNKMKIGGWVSVGVGGLMVVSGSLLITILDITSSFITVSGTTIYNKDLGEEWMPFAYGVMFGGYAIGCGAGIPLLVVGSKKTKRLQKSIIDEYRSGTMGYNYPNLYTPEINISAGTTANGLGFIVTF